MPLLAGTPVVIAGYNSPQQTVVSGPVEAVEQVCARPSGPGCSGSAAGLARLPLRARRPGGRGVHRHLRGDRFAPLPRPVVSTVTGPVLPADTDLAGPAGRQVLEPVRFTQAVPAWPTTPTCCSRSAPAGSCAGWPPRSPRRCRRSRWRPTASPSRACSARSARATPRARRSATRRCSRTGSPARWRPASRSGSSPAPPSRRRWTPGAGRGAPVPPRRSAAGCLAPVVRRAARAGGGGRARCTVDRCPRPRRARGVLRRLAAERAELPLEAVRPTASRSTSCT